MLEGSGSEGDLEEGRRPSGYDHLLIAVAAIRRSLPVLHAGRDFDVLARHTGLQMQVSGPAPDRQRLSTFG